MVITARLIIAAVLLVVWSGGSAQPTQHAADLSTFMGRKVTIIRPDAQDDYFPKGPATICLEGPPQRQCYTMPTLGNSPFGNNPVASVIQLGKAGSALLFAAETGGISGWQIHYSLLTLGPGNLLQDHFLSDVSVSNQSQYGFWDNLAISPAPIFVTADFVWGPDEGHYGEHRYIISAYIEKPSPPPNEFEYFLEDRYMTIRKYDSEITDILAAERQESTARLLRIRANSPIAGSQR